MSTDPGIREAFITGLYQLADYLADHPGIPVPQYGATILVPLGEQEDGRRPDIDYIAGEYQWPVHDEDGSYEAHQTFGPVGYTVYSLTRARIARHKAYSSYWGCVTPDEATSDA